MSTPAKFLALDVGLARIGVATCDPLWLSVRPLTVIQRNRFNTGLAATPRFPRHTTGAGKMQWLHTLQLILYIGS